MKKLIIIISMLFSVAYGQTCDTVTNLTFSLVTTSTARVTWTHATNKITYNWALYCLSGCGGIAQQSGNTAGNTLNLSGLNSSFAYQFCITTYCGATSSTPKCSNFTTLSPQIQYTPMTAAGYQFKYVKVDTGFNIPFQDTSLKRGTTRPGALVCNTADSNVYSYNGNYWELLQGVNSAANKVDSVIINSAGDSLFYWINGTSYGQVFGGASSRWSILGNSGTVAGTNFIGTTDSVRLDLRTNNTIRQSITGSGNVGIGTVTPSVTLDVYGSARIKGDGLGETFLVDSVDNINLQARSGTDPNFTDFNIDQANGFYFRKSGIDVLGNLANGESFMKSSDGFGSILVYPDSFHVLTNSTRRLTINSAGNIGIGTASPISKLHVTGTIRGTDSLILSGLGYGVGTQSLRRNGVTGAITWADTTAGGGGGTPSLTTNEIGVGVGGVLGSYATFNVDIPTFSLRLGQGDLTPTYVNFLGSNAGSTATNANRSNFLGLQAGNGATNADGSNFLGTSAGEGAENASKSNFLGTEAGTNATNASSSNFIGDNVGYTATNALRSNFLGFRTGYDAINSSYSNLFGYNVGMASVGDTLGSNNIIIGTNISMPNGTANSMNLGAVLYGTGFYSTTTGTPRLTALTTGKIGINTSTPSTALHVIGAIKATDSISFTGLLPMSAGTDSVVVRDVNGKFGTTAKSAFGSTYSAGYGLSLASTTFSADSSVLMTKGTTQVVSGAKTFTATTTHNGNIIFTDNTYDIGASGATRPRTGYFATSIVMGAGQNANINFKRTDGTTMGSIGTAVSSSSGTFTIDGSPGGEVVVKGANLFPLVTNTLDLGTSTKLWRTGYFGTSIGIGTTPDSALTVETSTNLKGNTRIQGTITLTDGANKSVGVSAAMTAGTITINNTRVTANSRIFLTHATVGGTQGILSVGTITAGTSFVINSSSVLDTGTVNWFIIN